VLTQVVSELARAVRGVGEHLDAAKVAKLDAALTIALGLD
jgi:hypothetical protein